MSAISPYLDMRDAFFEELYAIAIQDKDVVLLMADQGAFSFDKFKKKIPKQLINVGVSEQNMISVAAGMALSGKKVYAHAIANFTTLRCLEQIKVDLSIMNLPVVIVGVGAGYAYGADGPTHHANQDIGAMRAIPQMRILNGSDMMSLSNFPRITYQDPQLTYVRFDKGNYPNLYSNKEDFSKGVGVVSLGRDVCIVSTGVIVHTAFKLKEKLVKLDGLNPAIIDVYKLKPLNYKFLKKELLKYKKVVTIEEHIAYGGLGTIIADFISDENLDVSFLRIGLDDRNSFIYGDRQYMDAKMGLGLNKLVNLVTKFAK